MQLRPSLGPAATIEELEASGLRGRGEPGSRPARSRRTVAGNASPTLAATVVVNGEQELAVLEAPRLPLGPVDDHRGSQRRRGVPGDGPPLRASREPGPAAPAQPGSLELLDRGRRAELGRGCTALTASHLEIGIEGRDRLRIEHPRQQHRHGLSVPRDRSPQAQPISARSDDPVDAIVLLDVSAIAPIGRLPSRHGPLTGGSAAHLPLRRLDDGDRPDRAAVPELRSGWE